MSKTDKKEILDTVSESRRSFLKKAVKAGYVIPVVGTFTVTGLMSQPAVAAPNGYV